MLPFPEKKEIEEKYFENYIRSHNFLEEDLISENDSSCGYLPYLSPSVDEIKVLSGVKFGNKKEEDSPKDSTNKKKIFDINKFYDITTDSTVHFDESLFENIDFDLKKTTRSKNRQKRYQSREEILQNIKVNFIQQYLLKYLNDLIKSERLDECVLLFQKFPQSFFKKFKKEDNKNILNFSLYQIFVDKNIYKEEDSEQFNRNKKVVDFLKEKNSKVYKILHLKTYREAYQEYLASDIYRIHINKIRKKHGDEEKYIKRFIGLSKKFLEYYEMKKSN